MPAATIILPGSAMPSNLVVPEGVVAESVESDLYSICERVKEISESLHIVLLKGDPRGMNFAIMERCEDGVARLIYKVKELDARVLERLRYLMAVPFEQRFEQVEKDNHRWEQAQHEEQLEDLYERLGRPMWTELERCGFIDGRPVSYPKAGVATRGRKRR